MIIGLIADQYTKWCVRSYFDHHIIPSHSIQINKIFSLSDTWNYGIAFGMLERIPFFVISIINILLIIILVYTLIEKANNKITMLAFGMIISGAIGNMIDRILFGAVYDFIGIVIFDYHWPDFNIADSLINVGGFLLVFGLLAKKKHTSVNFKHKKNHLKSR